jgi:hypothetical protein
MNNSMSFESDSGNEFLFTDITFERLDASVTSHVSLQFLLCAERSIAVAAFERFFARVNSLKRQKSKNIVFVYSSLQFATHREIPDRKQSNLIGLKAQTAMVLPCGI